MPTPSRPRRGSMGFSPRKRAASEVPQFRSWAEADGEPRLQGYAGFKAGMTHVMAVDDHQGSPTEGVTRSVPVTVIETPPMSFAAVRVYRDTPYGLSPSGETWRSDADELDDVVDLPAEDGDEDDVRDAEADEVRVVAYVDPGDVDAVPSKTPYVMEVPVRGGDVEARVDLAFDLLEDAASVDDVHRAGEYADVAAVTKGKGTQGPVKRWGVQTRKGKHARQGYERRIGTLGPWHPTRVRSTVPQQGQTGYHQRTEVNKRVMSISDDDVTPEGGFVDYGEVTGTHVLLKGSVPGPKKRLVRTRRAVRPKDEPAYDPEIRYVSTESKQG
ncbi:MAG: 50S ribosomal protein L3 [Halobacteriota archaeon]